MSSRSASRKAPSAQPSWRVPMGAHPSQLARDPGVLHGENLPDSRSDWHLRAHQEPHHQGFELSSCGKEPGGTVTRVSKGILLAVLSVSAKAISSP
jgi:hypothetical protein